MPPRRGSVRGATCGRFDDNLHVIVPGGGCNPDGDPVIANWGPGEYGGVSGAFVTAHIDRFNPFKDLYSLFGHVVSDVMLKTNHGC